MAIHKDKLEHVVETFNNYNSHIQFTYELEVDNKIPFLDMLLIRQQNQQIKTEWYMKPIASGRFLNYNSFHPLHQKINMAKNFIHRVNYLSSNLRDDEKISIIDKQLSLNNYPKKLRHRLINRMHERNILTLQTTDKNLQTTYRSIAYIPYLSNQIGKHLKNDYKHIQLAHRNIKTVGKFYTKIKDPVPADHHSNVIYSIPCKQCSSCYIGMTSNMLKTRICGHKTHYNTWDKLLQDRSDTTEIQIAHLKEKTALMDHSIKHNHRFDFENTSILAKNCKPHALPYIEVCHIITSKNSSNKRTDTEGLNSIYAGIIHTLDIENQNKRKMTTNVTRNSI
ncbi:uncharacterized protein LOC131678430 [Topomyia yanbarensis]|uniref:uncharacterized protein LOC131678430 n=1 Tax=Topomyia yanbarensis TaxID=2498891 RepID=UPI00273C1ED3|nr:uncharacterized protein LOC131678430 [Topomyia yanbarensis]